MLEGQMAHVQLGGRTPGQNVPAVLLAVVRAPIEYLRLVDGPVVEAVDRGPPALPRCRTHRFIAVLGAVVAVGDQIVLISRQNVGRRVQPGQEVVQVEEVVGVVLQGLRLKRLGQFEEERTVRLPGPHVRPEEERGAVLQGLVSARVLSSVQTHLGYRLVETTYLAA